MAETTQPAAASAPPQLWTPAAYQEAFMRKEPVNIPEDSGLRGRILRGIQERPTDFDSLGLDGRELVFIMGPDALSELPGHPLHATMGRIGMMPSYVEGRIK